MTTEFIGVDAIIERVYKKVPPGDDIRRDDIVEWIWEAIRKIGALNGLHLDLYTYLVVEDYRVMIPSFLKRISQVSYVSGDIDIIDNTEELQASCRYKMSTALETWYQDKTAFDDAKGYRYKISNGYINTTFEKGIIEVYFKSFPVDENLEPTIPEEVFIIEAVTWYIVKQLTWKMYVRSADSYREIYMLADKEWKHYAGAAKTIRLLPGEDERVALANKYLRILPTDLWRNNTVWHRANIIDRGDLDDFISTP